MGCNPLTCVCGGSSCPLRYMIVALSLTGIIVAYGQRICINIVITTMVHKNASTNPECPASNSTLFTEKPISGGLHAWNEFQQEVILAAFFLGYFVMHIPGGILSDVLGARYVFGIGMTISTVLTAIFPIIVTYMPWQVVPVGRVLVGLCQATIYPAISTLYAKWIPVEERSTIGSLSFAANSVGIVIGNLVSGMVVGYVRNWTFAFYLWAGVGIIWLVLFFAFVYSEPQSHPRLTDKERDHLEERLTHASKDLKIPWKEIWTDMSMWAIVVGQCGHDYTIFSLITNFPKYMKDVLNYNIKENALATSFPYLAQWAGGITAGKFCDYFHMKKGVNLLLLRNICTFIGLTIPAAFMLVAGHMNCRRTMVMICFCCNLFTKGFFYSGLKINHLDMTVNFAGIIMAITNGIGALMGFVSPYVIALMAPDNTLKQWHLVYWIIFVLAAVTNIFYLIFARAHRRKWDVPENELDAWNKEREEEASKKAAKKEEKRRKKEGLAADGPKRAK